MSFGYIPDIPDEGDRAYAASLSKLGGPPPEFLSWLDFVSYWRGQASTSSCVAHGACQQAEIVLRQETWEKVENPLSRFAVYAGGRLPLPSGVTMDEGSRPRDVLHFMYTYPITTENRWSHEHGMAHVNERPPPIAEATGVVLKEKFRYSRVGLGLSGDALIEAVIDALRVGPVGVGRTVYDSYMTHRGAGVLPAPDAEERPAGQHYTIFTGYRENGRELEELGSWPNWGFHRDFIRSIGYVSCDHLRASYLDLWQLQPIPKLVDGVVS